MKPGTSLLKDETGTAQSSTIRNPKVLQKEINLFRYIVILLVHTKLQYQI
jgi:hypothetical protein